MYKTSRPADSPQDCRSSTQDATTKDRVIVLHGLVGIIAAGTDALVKLDSTHLETERDHVVVPCRHLMLIYRRDVVEQICHFLRHGGFDHA